MIDPHIVKSFDEQLNKLHDMVLQMGELAERQFDQAIRALIERNADSSGLAVAAEAEVRALNTAVNEQVIRVLCLRGPVADDLRVVVTALKIAAALDRIADYSAGVARRALLLNEQSALPTVRAVKRMGALVHRLLKEVMQSYAHRDSALAHQVWTRDLEVDELYSGLFRELLTYMMEDPANITASSNLLFIAKNVERIGDHATNIGEMVYFLVTGHPMDGERPKNDTSSYATGLSH
ncbi:MAG TPA: phosphate signaling complex protein PhoU [Patescibacteria group bacterium]|nr:phosphate signaling complex protein PhoU [Patescibacteria group bacterium]